MLFKFEHKNGSFSGRMFWATPGGAVEDGENYEDAARRELFEEVGLKVEHTGTQIAQRTAIFALTSGDMVEADERYFLVQADDHAVSDVNWSQLEREVMAAHRWWSQSDLESTKEQIWPEDIVQMLIDVGVWQAE